MLNTGIRASRNTVICTIYMKRNGLLYNTSNTEFFIGFFVSNLFFAFIPFLWGVMFA